MSNSFAEDGRADSLRPETETIESLRRQRNVAVNHLAEWCAAIDVRGSDWDDWDEFYKDAACREHKLPEIRELLSAAIAKAKASYVPARER